MASPKMNKAKSPKSPKSRSRSPRKSRSRSRSPRGMRSKARELMSDQDLVIMVALLAVYAGVFWYLGYKRDTVNWWKSVSPRSPSWGSEGILLAMYALLVLSVAVACYMCLRMHRDSQNRMVLYSVELLTLGMVLLTVYLYSDRVKKYEEPFMIFVVVLALTLFLTWRCYSLCSKYMGTLVPCGLAVATAAYLTAWSYKVKTGK